MKTVCEKCIFADYADSAEPCKMHIPQQIAKYHQASVSENNFYIIPDYYCRYGFDMDVYDKNQKDIGNLQNLQNQLSSKRQIRYYLVVDIADINNISNICDQIVKLKIKPKFVSFILHKRNDTKNIIQLLKDRLDSVVQWKIHNFLEDITLNNALSTIFDTNAKKNDTIYFWLKSDNDLANWGEEENNINDMIYLYQPKCHALFRSENKDGLFLSFDSYKDIKIHLNSDIFKGIDSIENSKFIYYA
jgi:hypothetical protein